jgi:hypothetical protein
MDLTISSHDTRRERIAYHIVVAAMLTMIPTRCDLQRSNKKKKMILAGKQLSRAHRTLKQAAAGARVRGRPAAFSMCIALRGCVLAAWHELWLCFMPLIYLWDKADRMLLRHALLLISPSCLSLRSFARSFFLIKKAVFLVRHLQPQPHHGRFDASFFCVDAFCLPSRMLSFSECRMAEQLPSRRGIIQKAKKHRRRTRSLQHPRAWRLLVLLS